MWQFHMIYENTNYVSTLQKVQTSLIVRHTGGGSNSEGATVGGCVCEEGFILTLFSRYSKTVRFPRTVSILALSGILNL